MAPELPSTEQTPISATVSVIIVNLNGRDWLEQCLPTVIAQSHPNFEVIVVDNGSTDGTTAWLARHWPQVQVLAYDRNLGFARANNIGIQAASGRYIVTLNNDTQVSPDWLEKMVSAAKEPDVGMVASHIVRWQQPQVLDSAGIEVDRAGIAWNRGWGQKATTALTSRDVFGPSAAAALYRRDMLDEVGLFDEDFFMYYEDVDIAWRAQRAGWRCRYVADAIVRHWHSATAEKSPKLKTFLNGRNKIWTILKNYEWPAILWALPLISLHDVLAIIYQMTRSRDLTPLRARISALLMARKMLAKRVPGKKAVALAPVASAWRKLTR